MKTTYAQAAQAVRKELKAKFPATTFSVRSEGFAGGDAVRISWTDGPTREEVEKVVNKYQYGSFDGMQDLYEYTNKRDDVPQVKYVQCDRERGLETLKKVVEVLANNYPDCNIHISEYGRVEGDYIADSQEWPSTLAHRMMSGYYRNIYPAWDFSK